MKTYDAFVIGAGPAGLSASLYLARFGLKVALAEKATPGGMLLQTSVIENYPGLPSVQGYALADAMEAQLKPYVVDRFAEVTGFEALPDIKRILLRDERVEARAVIICTGLSYRKLGLQDEERLTGHGVSYCAMCDGNFFKGLKVAVAGGGNSALEEAVYLSGLVKELHLIHRRDAFRADQICQDKALSRPNIVVHYNTVITALHGQDSLSGISLGAAGPAGAKDELLPVDGLFIFIGQSPNVNFLPPGLARDQDGFILTDTEMRCNLPGIFAAGDIRSKLCRQAAAAVGEGVVAAKAVHNYLESTHAR